MPDQFDVTLKDDDLLDEVELTTTLIVAASESDGPLSQEEIDRLLGVTPVRPEPRRESGGPDSGEVQFPHPRGE